MSNQTQPKTIADLDALQKSLNPAHLDRLPRPHNLLDAINNDASALVNPDPVIDRARQILATALAE